MLPYLSLFHIGPPEAELNGVGADHPPEVLNGYREVSWVGLNTSWDVITDWKTQKTNKGKT